MTRFILQKTVHGIVTLFIVSLLVFACTELLPGDVAEAMLGQYATPETLQAIRLERGLERPAAIRYLAWLNAIAHGDVGNSLANGQPIAPVVVERLANTLFLAGVAAAIAVPFSVLLGIVLAWFRDGWVDRAVTTVALAFVALPEFFLGYILIVLLSRYLHLFPSMALAPTSGGFLARLNAIGLPVITLSLVVVAQMMRMTRAAIIDVMGTPYVEMARLKGIPEWEVILRHALPNAIAPIITVVTFNLSYLVVGVIVVEVVFVYPGIGQLMVDAVGSRDVPTIQVCGVIFGAVYVGLNTLADIFQLLSNPRIRHA